MIKKQHFIIYLLFLMGTNSLAQSLAPKPPYPFDVKQLHCGHSLTAPLFFPWPGQYVELVADSNGLDGWQIMDQMVGNATLPGAWLINHWDTTTAACSPCYLSNSNPRYDIDQWELMVITENYEGIADFTMNNTEINLLNFVNNSYTYGNAGAGTPVMLWTNWPCTDGSGCFFTSYGITESTTGGAEGWREMLDFLEYEGVSNNYGWQRLQDYVNAYKPEGCPPVYIIPGNRMMARFYDDVAAGIVPTITHVNQIFTDGVHTNDIGAYMVSMIHYACIFNKTPIGLSNSIHPSVTIDAELAAYIQNMVWDLVTHYPRSGIFLGTNIIDPISTFNIFYDTNSKTLTIIDEPASNHKYCLIDAKGSMVFNTYSNIIDLSTLNSGVYFLKIKDKSISKKVLIY